MAAARSYAVMHGASVALRFEQNASDVTVQMFVDGDHDGLRTLDIMEGIDTPVDTTASIAQLFPGVTIGIAPEIGTDPVRIGTSDLLSFTPIGTATAGSIYLLGADGTQLAVRVLGATGRTRLERYVPSTPGWVSTF
jgi:hypothetical protein